MPNVTRLENSDLMSESDMEADRQSEFSDVRPQRRSVVMVRHIMKGTEDSSTTSLPHQSGAGIGGGGGVNGLGIHTSPDDGGHRVFSQSVAWLALRQWVLRESRGFDFLSVAMRFSRLRVTAIDLASLHHVLVGVGKLLTAVQTMTKYPSSLQEDGVIENPLVSSAVTHDGAGPMMEYSATSVATRAAITELRNIGAMLKRCSTFMALSDQAHLFATELAELEMHQLHVSGEQLPNISRQLQLHFSTHALSARVRSLNSDNAIPAADGETHAQPVMHSKDSEQDLAAVSLMPPVNARVVMTQLQRHIVSISPTDFNVMFHVMLGLSSATALVPFILCLAYHHYLTLILLIPALILKVAALLCRFWRAPLVFYLLEIISACLTSIAFTVEDLVYPGTAAAQFPLSLISIAVIAYFGCAMCDLPTMRLQGGLFRSSLLTEMKHASVEDSQSSEDEREADEDPIVEYRVEPWIAKIVTPAVTATTLAISYFVRLGLDKDFQNGSRIVGEVVVSISLGVLILRYWESSVQRLIKEEEHFCLVEQAVRSAWVVGLQESSMPSRRSDGGGIERGQITPPSDRPELNLLSLPMLSGSGNGNEHDVTVTPGRSPVPGGRGGRGGGPVGIGNAPTSVGHRSGLDASMSINELLEDGSGGRGPAGRNNTIAARLSGRVSSTPVLTSQPAQSKENSMSNNQAIVLAGKHIASHGEMLLNVATLNKVASPTGASSATNLWRTPLDDVHLSTILIGVDSKGDIVLWNWFAEDLTQFHPADMIGRNILSILPSTESHAEMFSKITTTMSDRVTSTIRCSIVSRRVGKPTIEVSLQPYPAKTASGSTVGVLFAGTPVRHETLQEIGNQLLEIHAALPDGSEKTQLYKSLLLLQSELPKTTIEVNIPNLLGRIFSAQFQSKAILLDVQDRFPPSMTVDTESFQLVIMEMLQHYLRMGTVHVYLSSDVVAQSVDVKVLVENVQVAEVTKWKPSVTAMQAARRMNCLVRTENVRNSHCSLTIVGALGSQENQTQNDLADEVRCNVAIYDTEALSAILVRNIVWERKHMLFFIEDINKLALALDGVDILFARLPRGLVERVAKDLKEQRPLLEMIVIASNDNSDRKLFNARMPQLSWVSVMEDPILTSELNDMLTAKVKVIANRRKREDKVSDIRKLFTQTKSCPWVRGKLLGRGANATVYEATNTITGGKMAVRTLRINPEQPEELKSMMESLIEEVKVMSKLEHKNIINYLYLERDPLAINVFMEYAPGGSIRSLLDKRGRISCEQVAIWLRDILEGLAYLHSEGIIHLDIKSANVLLAADGTCKLSDFGTARQMNTSSNALDATQRRSSNAASANDNGGEVNAAGTLPFMAPEVLSGLAFDWRADIWSLGCMTMEMLTGKLPFAQLGPLAIVGYVSCLKSGDAVPIPSDIVDPGAISFISTCLCVDPSGRPNARTLQNHPFIVQQSARQVTMPRASIVTSKPRVAESDEDDSSTERRESCFSAWSAQGADQFHERRRATGVEW